jgi:Cof subfamily protein (haloacid dehalogenase superfamily)
MKALASDFDGTFYFMKKNDPIKKCDIEAVKEFQDQGNLFGFCTGRPLYGILDYLNNETSADFYITNNGATIFDKDFNLIFEKTIPKDITDALISYGVEHNYEVDFHMDGKFIAYKETTTFITDFVYSLDEIQGKVHSITYNALTEENADALASHVNHLFHGKVNAFRNKEFVDIIPDGCSKGMGIDIVRNILKIDTFAGIGDSMNDSPMLENVDIAFTFPYAPKALQEKASQIVNSVAEAIHSMV